MPYKAVPKVNVKKPKNIVNIHLPQERKSVTTKSKVVIFIVIFMLIHRWYLLTEVTYSNKKCVYIAFYTYCDKIINIQHIL